MKEDAIYYGQPKNLQFHWCGFFETTQAWRHDARVNPDYELMIGARGTLFLTFEEGKKVTLQPGEMLLIEPNRPFCGARDSESVSFYWLHFAAEDLSKKATTNLQGWQLPFYTRDLLLDNELVLLQQMQLIKQANYPDRRLLDAYCYTLLLSISEKFKNRDQATNDKHFLIDYVKQFLRLNYQQPLTVAQIANYFGYNKAYLSNLFSKEAGLTLSQYLNGIRLEAARQQLLTTNDPIQMIAFENGFTDEKYFSRLFSRRYSLAPRTYRKKFGPVQKM